MSKGAVHIGTSGWHYKHWLGPFYPPRQATSKMCILCAAVRHSRVEQYVLSASYRKCASKTGRVALPRFCFAAKGSRYLTHMKKLKDPSAGIGRYLEAVELLGRKLGPIVFQLPPFWDVDMDRLEGFAPPAAGAPLCFRISKPHLAHRSSLRVAEEAQRSVLHL